MQTYRIGIDVGGTNTKMMVMDAQDREMGRCVIKTEPEKGYEHACACMLQAVDALFERAGITEKKVAGVAMGLPGMVDFEEQKTICLSVLGWDGFNPCEEIGRYYGAPCIIDNDANVNALGEYVFGMNKKARHMVLLTLGTGLGCGVIIEGKVFRGSENLSTELGHMTIVADGGDTCLCGRPGHLEAYSSGTAMARHAQYILPQYPDSALHGFIADNAGVYDNSMIEKGVRQGDAASTVIFRRFVRYLAIGVGNVMKLFNPELVLIGGGIANAGDILLDPLNAQVKEQVLHQRQCCPVRRAVLGDFAGMYGACALAAECKT
ncbi:MAG: ROK family protein [Christensenellales bacterium]|jgi:glucokinase